MKKSIETNKALCPVCGKAHVDEYDICEVCNWENDPVQLVNPDLAGEQMNELESSKRGL